MVAGVACGCGSAPNIDFYDGDPPSASPGSGGNLSGGSAGVSGSFGASGAAGGGVAGTGIAGGAGTAGNPGDGRCDPAIDVNAQSYTLNTTGPVCLRVQQDIQGWGCSNADDRTIRINGVALLCGALPLPPKVSGSYFFDVSAGALTYAYIYWF